MDLAISYVSVSIEMAWWAGGAYNSDTKFYTFRADTGELTSLLDILGKGDIQVLQELITLMKKNSWSGQNFDCCTLDHFEFYISNGAVWAFVDPQFFGNSRERIEAFPLPDTIEFYL